MLTPALLALALAAAPDGGVSCGGVPCEVLASPAAAFSRLLTLGPTVLALGEYHETEGAPRARSALWHTTRELLPLLRHDAGVLIAETWMTTGRCGQVEKQAVAAVKSATQRPDSTEDELTTMMGRAYDLGFENHILLVSCDEYRGLLDAQGELDAERSLTLVATKVEALALDVLESGRAGTPHRPLVLYGGALHNDLAPLPGFEAWSFGPRLLNTTDGGYLEADLVVPEYGERDADLPRTPWFAPARERARGGRAVLVHLGPRSVALVFSRAAPRPPARVDGGPSR